MVWPFEIPLISGMALMEGWMLRSELIGLLVASNKAWLGQVYCGLGIPANTAKKLKVVYVETGG